MAERPVFFPEAGNDINLITEIPHGTLIIPTVSMGNTPQLAVDLLIHTLNLKLAGSLDERFLYPFAGTKDYVAGQENKNNSGTSTWSPSLPLEVYSTEDGNYAVVQQRSPILPGRSLQFLMEVVIPFALQAKFKRIVVLGSADAGLRLNPEGDWTVKFSTSLTDEMHKMSLEDRSHLLEDVIDNPVLNNLFLVFSELQAQINDPNYKIKNEIVQYIVEETKKLPFYKAEALPEILGLVMYVYEGDNTVDAKKLASEVLQTIEIPAPTNQYGEKAWKMPVSWNGMYGLRDIPNALEQGLYN